MDIRTLKLYLHLCQSCHFGRSSEAMHVSPSTLSRSIHRLEQELGVQLFERDNRKVELTQAGQTVQLFAQQFVESWQQLHSQLHQEAQQLSGQLRIYCSVTASYSILINLLTAFRRLYPKIEVILETGDAALALDKVSHGECDLAIAPKTDPFPAQLVFEHLLSTPLVFIRPTMAGEVRQATLQANIDWPNIPLVVSEFGLARKRLNQWFERQKMPQNIYTQVAGHEAIVSMVGLGFGVGVVPAIVLTHSPMQATIEAFEVTPKLEDFQVGLCVAKRKQKDPLVAAFWQSCMADRLS